MRDGCSAGYVSSCGLSEASGDIPAISRRLHAGCGFSRVDSPAIGAASPPDPRFYSHTRSHLRTMERSIEPVPVEETCANHVILPELFVATNRKYQHDLIDRNAPAVIQVEDVGT